MILTISLQEGKI